MNSNITKVFTVVCDNKVLIFETNLREFVRSFIKVEPKSRNYHWYYREFHKRSEFSKDIGSNTYFFQQLV